ncbi:MAG: hypothetical protein II984_11275, partial [Clostridia bacterium]|nr:hypothetical protein [Clostridia bacterium]
MASSTYRKSRGHAPVPCLAAGKITQNACISSMQIIAYHRPKGAYHQPSGCMSFAKCENDFGHAPVP